MKLFGHLILLKIALLPLLISAQTRTDSICAALNYQRAYYPASQYRDVYKNFMLEDSETALQGAHPEMIDALRERCSGIKDSIRENVRTVYELLQKGNSQDLTVTYVYLNALQESQEFVTSLRKLLRASGKLNLDLTAYRSFSNISASDLYNEEDLENLEEYDGLEIQNSFA